MGAPRHVWVDASAGVAGDMLLGALVDAGADLGNVQSAIDAVIPASVRLRSAAVIRAGLRATKVHVDVLVADPPHRTWRTIHDLLSVADVPAQVREAALAVFGRLAAAEADVHGISAEDVHFHEVGALDSIADVVGVCAALNDLDVVRVTAGEVAVGSGRVAIAHGDVPVPVPAVIELLYREGVDQQPSGGAIGSLSTLHRRPAPCRRPRSLRAS
jgi:pyridinium-3,5-bisthiocarboxylic acid mononucleotide nickel chelatase